MRNNKYIKWKECYGLESIRRLAEEGLSDDEIAIRSGIGVPLFRRWKKRCSEFAAAIALGRSASDYAVIEALYKKAVGYNVSVAKTYKLKHVDYDPDTGKKIREYEELATAVDESYIPPDLRAETFWLKNRQPDRWQDKPEREADGSEDGVGGIVEIPHADMIDPRGDGI